MILRINHLLSIVILLVILVSCDQLYKTQSDLITWEVKTNPTEVIHVDAKGSGSLGEVTTIKNRNSKDQELLLMVNNTIPSKDVIDKLYSIPIDSLVNDKYVFDTEENAFIPIGLLKISGTNAVRHLVDMPFVGEHNYIFGIPSSSDLDVEISLQFHKIADSTAPVVKIVKLK